MYFIHQILSLALNQHHMYSIFVVEEIIEFRGIDGSPVSLVALNASSLFDRVEYCKLPEFPIECNMCPMFLGLLLYMYTEQKLRVNWDSRSYRKCVCE